MDVVKLICWHLDGYGPSIGAYENRITFVKDRPRHDFRYAMNIAKVKRAFGWKPKKPFEAGLGEVIAWYLANEACANRSLSAATT